MLYLDENPNAGDTADGILQWWLLERTIVEQQEALNRALDCLVDRNLIIAVQTADGRRHYHLNAQQTEEIRRLISEAKPGEALGRNNPGSNNG